MVMDRLWDRIPILSILPRQDRNPIPRRHGFAHSNLAGNFHCRKVERMSGDPLLVANPSLPPWLWPRAAYVHVPFCAHHCGYCDFAVATGQDAKIDLYIDALTEELSKLGEPQPVETLFLGGGTPTYLSARQLERLLKAVTHWLPLESGHEFSVEANPGTLDAEKARVLAGHGVNRVSLGAQSFEPKLLRVLERDHQPPDVPRAVDCIRKNIECISLDLIYAVPYIPPPVCHT